MLALTLLFISAIYFAFCVVYTTGTIINLIFPLIPNWMSFTIGIVIIVIVECIIFTTLAKEE